MGGGSLQRPGYEPNAYRYSASYGNPDVLSLTTALPDTNGNVYAHTHPTSHAHAYSYTD